MSLSELKHSLWAVKEVAKLRASGVPFPPVAPRLGREGVYIGAANSAGQGWAWARALEQVRPELRGVSARFGPLEEDSGFAFQVDLPIYSRYASLSTAWQRRQFAALKEYRAALIESGDAIFSRMYSESPGAQARALQQAGVQVALLFHGSDIRDPDRHLGLEPYSHFAPDPEFTRVFREVTARNRRLVEDLDVPVFVSTPDLLDELPGLTWLPVVVEPGRWARDTAPLSDGTVMRVAHLPSHSMIKGTELVEPILTQMSQEGVIEYRSVQGIAHADMPDAYRGADVVLDQFRTGIYGVAACEAMAAGRIVVSHVSRRVRELTFQVTGEHLPVIEATHETLRDLLLDIRSNPGPYLEIAARGPGFVRRHHDGRRSGQVLSEWLRDQ